jgi:aminopeptidase N
MLGVFVMGISTPGARAQQPAPDTPARKAADIHSYSRPTVVKVKNLDLDWTVDFERKVLKGTAIISFERLPGAVKDAPLILDTKDLLIESISAPGHEALQFDLGARDPILGSPLTIRAPDDVTAVRIAYQTSPAASALQWLSPSQTAGGKHPFLFTQSEAIHARSWIPCQDSPGVRVTYKAKVRVPEGLTAVMSADARGQEMGVFSFEMPQSIPSYLIALAVGDLVHRPLGERTGVYAEPSLADAAAHEFADTEKMIEVAEKRFGPYRWGRYDLLVLPPSFPFGGMENAKLTFLTPTVIVGDRSLVGLIGHELAHSWSGNLVTNATWRDFWLNEGFTTYIERRITEDVYGVEVADMERVLGEKALREDLARYVPNDQVLHIDLSGRDPDDGMTRIPYEKGALFLTRLEQVFGREKFDPFLKGYFDYFAFKSITTAEFEEYVRKNLFPPDAKVDPVDLHLWLHTPGLPADAPLPKSSRFALVDELARKWLDGAIETAEIPWKDWGTLEQVHFLNVLPERMPNPRLAELDEAFHFTETTNAEIAEPWLLRTIRSGYAPAAAKVESFLIGNGRRKYVLPLYEAILKTNGGRERAEAIFANARAGYHPITVDSVERLLKKKPE